MRIVYLVLFLIFIQSIAAQVKDNFDDGDIVLDPTWSGAVGNFRIDENKALRLNAQDAGQSFIYTTLMYPDSFILDIDVKLEFNPSATNYTRLYFMLDKANLTEAKGYYINIGENGSADALRLYKLESGKSQALGTGKEGKLATDPAMVKLRVVYRQGGIMTIYGDYDANGIYEDFYEVQNSDIVTEEASFFGIECVYSATRKDKFVFDNFEIKAIVKDTTPPILQKVELINDRAIEVFFDEILDKNTASDIQNFEVEGIGNPIKISIDSLRPSSIVMTFDKNFISGKNYLLLVKSVKDVSQNIANNLIANFTYIRGPRPGDLVISEILFDPYVNQQDFLEVYNKSEETLELKGLRIKNDNNNQVKEISTSYFLKSKQYLAIATDTLSLIKTYAPKDNAYFLKSDLPAFNNDVGIVSLLLADDTVLDSFHYNVRYHLFINDNKSEEGVSLEKIKLERMANQRANWHSAAKAVNYATPGYANSNQNDTTAPSLIQYEVKGQNQIELTFDDVLNQESVATLSNYQSIQNLGMPINASFKALNTNIIVLTYTNPFEVNKVYEFEVAEIEDKNGNRMQEATIVFAYGQQPDEGDLVISEVLFNPYSQSVDFVEVYNASNNNIQLKGLTILNTDNEQERQIASYYVLEPKRQVAIAEDINSIKKLYNCPDTARFLQNELPALNADKGNITLVNEDGTVLDSFEYNESRHQLLFDKEDVKGVSLEKLQLIQFANDKSNWHSSSRANNYATPGYKNSNAVVVNNVGETFFINKTTFSPNGDGKDDLLVLGYNLEAPGYLANIEVYSSSGFKVKNLAKNELLGTTGIITWDGSNEDGTIENVGIYILKGSIYNESGEVRYFKKECILANFID